jgi:hypothetical protein
MLVRKRKRKSKKRKELMNSRADVRDLTLVSSCTRRVLT